MYYVYRERYYKVYEDMDDYIEKCIVWGIWNAVSASSDDPHSIWWVEGVIFADIDTLPKNITSVYFIYDFIKYIHDGTIC